MHSQGAKESYDWDVLMLYMDELKIVCRMVITFVAVLEDVLLWRKDGKAYVASICLCVGHHLLREARQPRHVLPGGEGEGSRRGEAC